MTKIAVLVATAGATLATASVTQARVGTTSELPFVLVAYVPCANDGLGELVDLSGTLHVLATSTVDAKGGINTTIHFNAENVSGTGETSGGVYRAAGTTRTKLELQAGSVTTYVDNFLIIGAGNLGNFRVHENLAVVVNAQGAVTATVDDLRTSCT